MKTPPLIEESSILSPATLKTKKKRKTLLVNENAVSEVKNSNNRNLGKEITKENDNKSNNNKKLISNLLPPPVQVPSVEKKEILNKEKETAVVLTLKVNSRNKNKPEYIPGVPFFSANSNTFNIKKKTKNEKGEIVEEKEIKIQKNNKNNKNVVKEAAATVENKIDHDEQLRKEKERKLIEEKLAKAKELEQKRREKELENQRKLRIKFEMEMKRIEEMEKEMKMKAEEEEKERERKKKSEFLMFVFLSYIMMNIIIEKNGGKRMKRKEWRNG
jgi:hypothetical protein